MCHGVDGDHCSTDKARFTVDMAADRCVDCHYSFSPHDAHTYHVYISNNTHEHCLLSNASHFQIELSQ